MFHSTFFCGISGFKYDDMQNYLGFHSVSRYFETIPNTNKVTVSKTERKSDEGIKPPPTSDNSFNSGINFIDNDKILVAFDGKN